jgi:hypothetical protein
VIPGREDMNQLGIFFKRIQMALGALHRRSL